jgi:hypothetical protein
MMRMRRAVDSQKELLGDHVTSTKVGLLKRSGTPPPKVVSHGHESFHEVGAKLLV